MAARRHQALATGLLCLLALVQVSTVIFANHFIPVLVMSLETSCLLVGCVLRYTTSPWITDSGIDFTPAGAEDTVTRN